MQDEVCLFLGAYFVDVPCIGSESLLQLKDFSKIRVGIAAPSALSSPPDLVARRRVSLCAWRGGDGLGGAQW